MKILVVASLSSGTVKTVIGDKVTTEQFGSQDRVLEKVGTLLNDGFELVSSSDTQITLTKDPNRKVRINKNDLSRHFFGD